MLEKVAENIKYFLAYEPESEEQRKEARRRAQEMFSLFNDRLDVRFGFEEKHPTNPRAVCHSVIDRVHSLENENVPVDSLLGKILSEFRSICNQVDPENRTHSRIRVFNREGCPDYIELNSHYNRIFWGPKLPDSYKLI